MKEKYDSIYLSPHLDDVALSCGGQIFLQTEAGKDILIVTIAAGEPQSDVRSLFVEFLHHNWGYTAEEAMAARRAEDAAASQRLGADYLHWLLPDAIYRVDPVTEGPLYTSNDDIFGELDAVETELVDAMAAEIALLPAAGRVVAPLTIGHHVDHQLTRAAAEKAFAGKQLHYYEDYPYVQRHPEALAALVVPSESWRSELIRLGEEAIQARLQASLCYESQIGSLFNDRETMKERIRAQIRETGGERLWQRLVAAE